MDYKYIYSPKLYRFRQTVNQTETGLRGMSGDLLDQNNDSNSGCADRILQDNSLKCVRGVSHLNTLCVSAPNVFILSSD
jgi:hypothetical protein